MRRGEIEIEITIAGAAADVLDELRALKPGKTNRRAVVTAKVIRSGDRRRYEPFALPAIENGDTSRARDSLDRLARQALIEPDIERGLDDALAALGTLTARAG